MKQTVKEAAKENILFNHRTVDRTLFGKDLAKFGEMNFVQGAEWQSKQSPWISVNERLPENEDMVFTKIKMAAESGKCSLTIGFCTDVSELVEILKSVGYSVTLTTSYRDSVMKIHRIYSIQW